MSASSLQVPYSHAHPSPERSNVPVTDTFENAAPRPALPTFSPLGGDRSGDEQNHRHGREHGLHSFHRHRHRDHSKHGSRSRSRGGDEEAGERDGEKAESSNNSKSGSFRSRASVGGGSAAGSKERRGERGGVLRKYDSVGSGSGGGGVAGMSRSETRDENQDQTTSTAGVYLPATEVLETPPPTQPRSETTVGGAGVKSGGFIGHGRRSSNRSSGSFLLSSIGRGKGGKIPRILQGRSSGSSKEEGKGKSPTLNGDVVDRPEAQQTPQSRLRNSHSQQSSSVGSSPLSSEVKADAVEGANGNGNGTLTPNYGTVRARQSSPLNPRSGSLDILAQKIEVRKRPTTSVGYDTDTAQVVNMALSLSEARKRQASERRYISGGQHDRQRVVSTASTTGARNSRQPVGSVAQYLQAQRTPSMRSSGAQTPKILTDDRRSSQVGTPDVPIGDENDVMDDDFDPEISEPTKARVEKARAFFELAYEHRRLLSHLPPVRRPGTDWNPNDSARQSKAYNPLQYIRNRKLRIWDKSTIDGEADGWHDVQKVRIWVDAVMESHTETRHDSAECVRLPPLTQEAESVGSREGSQQDSQQDSKERHPQRIDGHIVRPKRPRSDWVTHPGDIIADCFWLEQGMNKLKILDRDSNTIYPPSTQFKFSGWRNRTPVHVPEGLHSPTPPEEPDDELMEDEREPLHPVSELPTFRSASKRAGRDSHGRKRSKIKDSVAAADEGGLAKGLRVFMEDSDSSTSGHSSGSESPGAERGRRRLRKRQKQISEVSPGQIPPPQPPRHQQQLSDPAPASDQSLPSSKQHSKRTSIDHGVSGLGRFLKRESHSKNVTPANRSMTRAEHRRQESTTKYPSLDERPRSSGEYESTAPNSPTHNMWPSIAINLESPPQSRSPSPTKRHIPSILKPLHRHHRHESVQEKDLGDHSKRSSVVAPVEEEKTKEDSREHSRGTSPMTRGQSPMTKRDSHTPAAYAAGEHHDVTRVSTKSTAPSSDHSKIRGIFKGGRIAEIVGHEVSRVGDFIWKKEAPVSHRRRNSDDSGRSGYDSDTEAEPMNGTVVKTPPGPVVRSRSSTISSTKSNDSPVVSNKSPPGSGGRPKLNNPNLPSFTSPFDRDREEQQRKEALLTPPALIDDHIARQAADHRSASRSPRLDRLAPPRLSTSGRSASPNRLETTDSNISGLALQLTRSRDASEKLNSALNERTGSPALAAMRRRQSAIDLSRISTHDIDLESPYVTWRDIQRAGTLLLSSAVKAREIARRADEPRDKKPAYIVAALAGGGGDDAAAAGVKDLSAITRRQEHVVAARALVSSFTTHASHFDTRLQHFTTSTAPSLHRQLQELEDLVDNRLTPRVRRSADEAGELSMQLSTTSTLAVKGVNEAIDSAVAKGRKLRGPVALVRRGWYKGVEVAVVGLLWGIWAVVSLVRVVIAVGHGVVLLGSWLVWAD